MWKEFKEFALKGNALSLAIGVIIGAASARSSTRWSTTSSCRSSASPAKADFTNYFFPLSQRRDRDQSRRRAEAGRRASPTATSSPSSINFLIVAVALFIVIKGINSLNAGPGPEPAAPPPPSDEVVLLTADSRRAGQAPGLTRDLSRRAALAAAAPLVHDARIPSTVAAAPPRLARRDSAPRPRRCVQAASSRCSTTAAAGRA